MTTSFGNRIGDIEVDSTLAGLRLDRGLAVALPGMSRTRVKAAIEAERVRVNGRLAKASMLLAAGMHVEVFDSNAPELLGQSEPGDGALAEVQPETPTPLVIVYEDQELLVVDKPAGLVVHPSPGHSQSTLVDSLLSHVAELRALGDTARPGIVHRLDKDTSGLLVVAKNATAHANLAEQMKSRSTIKRYLADAPHKGSTAKHRLDDFKGLATQVGRIL